MTTGKEIDTISELKIQNGGSVCRDFDESKSKYCVYGEKSEQWNTCTGELGSPLVYNNTNNNKLSLYGLASTFAGKKSDCFVPRFYTSNYDHMDWIITRLI